VLEEYHAIPIDYRSQDFAQVVRSLEPGGLDAVFDGIGGDYLERGFALLKRGGAWVGYANPHSLSGMFSLLGKIAWLNLLPNGRRVMLYGTGSSFIDQRPFRQDWKALFEMVSTGQIKPIIAARFPILEAAQANALLESGQVTGNIVLYAPSLQEQAVLAEPAR
jgi:NADPH:quinone reductase-like Zn-dependent oxidoreductase